MTIGCRTKGCGRIAHSRDVCIACYRRFAQRVAKGKTTWAELEAKGLIAKSKPRPANWGYGKRIAHGD